MSNFGIMDTAIKADENSTSKDYDPGERIVCLDYGFINILKDINRFVKFEEFKKYLL
jgi:hypothetical protein